jgi:hypothetical protein
MFTPYPVGLPDVLFLEDMSSFLGLVLPIVLPKKILLVFTLKNDIFHFCTPFLCRDANEPKTRFFGKFSNPEPVPEPESNFLRTQYLNPNPNLKFLKYFV